MIEIEYEKDELNLILHKKQQQIDDLTEDCMNLSQRLKEEGHQYEMIKREKFALEESMSAFQDELSTNRENQEKLNDTLRQVNCKLTESLKDKQRLEDEVDTLKKTLEEEKNKCTDALNESMKYRWDMEDLNSRILRLDLTKESLENELDRLHKQLKDLEKENQELTSRIEKNDKKSSQDHSERLNLESELERISENLRNYKSKYEAAQLEIEELKMDLNKLKSEKNEIQDEGQVLMHKLTSANEEILLLHDRIDVLREKLSETKLQLNSTREIFVQQEDRYKLIEMDKKNLLVQIKELKMKNSDYSSKLTSIEEQNVALNDTIEEMRNLLRNKEDDINEIQELYKELEVEINLKRDETTMLRKKIKSCEGELKSMALLQIENQNEQTRWQNKMIKVDRENNELKSCVSRLQREKSELEEIHLKNIVDLSEKQKFELNQEYIRYKEQKSKMEIKFSQIESNLKQRIENLEVQNSKLQDQFLQRYPKLNQNLPFMNSNERLISNLDRLQLKGDEKRPWTGISDKVSSTIQENSDQTKISD